MTSTDGDAGPCGKGEAAENSYAARAYLFGRDENIGATVIRDFLGCCAI